MKTPIIMSMLVLSAAAITPASANWFSNPYEGISRCVCSAPSPTPEQVRANRLPIVVKDEMSPDATVADASTTIKQANATPPARTPAPAQPAQTSAR